MSPSEQPDLQRFVLRPLQKRAPPAPISERLSALKPLTPLATRLALKTASPAAVAEVIQAEIMTPEIPVYPIIKVPEAESNFVAWDKAELAKLNPAYGVHDSEVAAVPALSKAAAIQSPVILAERKAAFDALVQGRKSEFLEKRAQFDTTLAQKKAVLQTEGAFDRNSLLGKLKKKSEE